jgi:hypothetical protein
VLSVRDLQADALHRCFKAHKISVRRLTDDAPLTRENTMNQKPNRAVAAAITAAVMGFIKAEEEALNTTAVIATSEMAVPRPAPTATGSFYGASGRQQMMEMRRLLSLRMTRR